MNVSEQLKIATEAAIKAGTTRYRIAIDAGIDQAALARFLDEGRDIRSSTFAKLCDYLGLELRQTDPKRR